MSVEEIVDYYRNRGKPINNVARDISLKQLQSESGLECSYSTFKAYVHQYKDKDINEIIEHLKNNYRTMKTIEENSLSKIWRDYSLNCNLSAFIAYRRRHPELSDNEVIIHYRPDCYINILGELAIQQEDGTNIRLK